jgi:hypothetical protein
MYQNKKIDVLSRRYQFFLVMVGFNILSSLMWWGCGEDMAQTFHLKHHALPAYKDAKVGVLYGDFKSYEGILIAMESHTAEEPIFYFECRHSWQESRPGGHTVSMRLSNNKGETLMAAGGLPDSWLNRHWPNYEPFTLQADFAAAKQQVLNTDIEKVAPECLYPMYFEFLFDTPVSRRITPASPNEHYAEPSLNLSAHDAHEDTHSGDDWAYQTPESLYWLQQLLELGRPPAIETHPHGMSRSWGRISDMKHRGPIRPDGVRRGRHDEPGIFKEVLFLFSGPIGKTGWDHTATVTEVFKLIDARINKWDLAYRYETCNHGACPWDRGMRQYEVCEPEVLLQNWWAIDNECRGMWLFGHLCNDDTALQISNGFGTWSGEYCRNPKRFHRPNCRRHW